VKKKQRKEAYTARAKADLAPWLAQIGADGARGEMDA
jgi:hypothetical protein